MEIEILRRGVEMGIDRKSWKAVGICLSRRAYRMEIIAAVVRNGTAPVGNPVSVIQPYNIANYVVAALYIALIVWATFNLYTHLSARLLIDAPKMLFGHVIVWAVCRVIFAFLPNKVWEKLRNNQPVLQVALDLLPEFLFLCIFNLLISMWTNVFARSRHLQIRKPENILWISHGVLCGALLMGAIILVSVVAGDVHLRGNRYSTHYRPWESYWIVASAVIILVGTICFGIGVARSLSKMQLISDFLKRQASKVRLLVIVTFLGILLKVVYNLVIGKYVNQWRKTHSNTAKPFAAIIFFYFFLTDIVPVVLILIVFISPKKTRRTHSGREYTPYSEDDVSSSDGLLSNEENY